MTLFFVALINYNIFIYIYSISTNYYYIFLFYIIYTDKTLIKKNIYTLTCTKK